MVFLPCAELALERGIGKDLAAVRRSPEFLELLSEERANRRRTDPKSLAGLVGSRDPIEVNYLLNSVSPAEAVTRLKRLPRFEVNLKERALMRYLGRNLARAAAPALPQEAVDLAGKWKGSGLRARIAICRRLLQLLEYKGPVMSIREQAFNQTNDTVLPLQFLKTGKYHCLGCAEIVQSFCQLAGARSYAVIPHRLAQYEAFELEARYIERFIEEQSQLPGAASKASVAGYQKWLRSWKVYQRFENWLHIGIVVELGPGAWALLDPYQRQLGFYTRRDKDMTAKISMLDQLSPSFPGLKLCHRSESSVSRIRRSYRDLYEGHAVARHFGQRLKDGVSDEQELAWEIPSEILRLEERVSGEPLVKKETLEEVGSHLRFEPGAIHALRQSTFFAKVMGKAANRMRETGSINVAEEMPVYLAELALDAGAEGWKRRRGKNLVHPIVEIGDAEYTIAAATLAHLACFEPDTKPLMRRIINHCGSQFWLLYYAGEITDLPTESILHPRLHRAWELLGAYEHKLARTKDFLAQFVSDN